MWRVLAAVMLIVVAALAGTDPLLCPDGCNDESQQRASSPPPPHADCLACRNAIATAMPVFDFTPGRLVETTCQGLPQLIEDSIALSIDHPPRAT